MAPMDRAFSPLHLVSAFLGRWPRLVWSCAFGALSSRGRCLNAGLVPPLLRFLSDAWMDARAVRAYRINGARKR